MAFRFAMRERVRITETGETGFVVGRDEYIYKNNGYHVRIADRAHDVERRFEEPELAADAIVSAPPHREQRPAVSLVDESKRTVSEALAELAQVQAASTTPVVNIVSETPAVAVADQVEASSADAGVGETPEAPAETPDEESAVAAEETFAPSVMPETAAAE